MGIEVAGLLLGLAGAYLSWRELVSLPQKAQQEILDRLREPPASGLQWGSSTAAPQDRIDDIVKSGMDAADLNARFALPQRHLWRAIRKLYSKGKIDVFLLEAPISGHADMRDGAVGILPIFVRGALPPDLRPPRERVEAILSQLR